MVPEELDELIPAGNLGVSVAELRGMSWDDVQDQMAFERGRDIAAGSDPPSHEATGDKAPGA